MFGRAQRFSRSNTFFLVLFYGREDFEKKNPNT
jgi:hypothetical protein